MSEMLYPAPIRHWHMLVLVVLLVMWPHLVTAQIYKCEDEVGNINFSDEPCKKDEYSTRLNWLKSKPPGRKTQRSSGYRSETAKKTARKAKKSNEAYVLLTLLTTSQLVLETASLRSSLGGAATEQPELLLSDGITVDLLKVDKMTISAKLGKNRIRVRFIMDDGYEEVKTIRKPYPVISGEAKIGRFSKSLADIKQIEFFNSKKLLKARDRKIAVKKKKTSRKITTPSPVTDKSETPVIELDLSHELSSGTTAQAKAPAPVSKKPAADSQLPVRKLTPGSSKQTVKKPRREQIAVVFANDKKTSLSRSSLLSSKGGHTARAQHFILNEREQIPYEEIKTIRVRPTGDKNKLVVAVALKSGEIKMENMSQPFTRIQGQTASAPFNHSLLDIKSISFQR